jgi:hypothetical protein
VTLPLMLIDCSATAIALFVRRVSESVYLGDEVFEE